MVDTPSSLQSDNLKETRSHCMSLSIGHYAIVPYMFSRPRPMSHVHPPNTLDCEPWGIMEAQSQQSLGTGEQTKALGILFNMQANLPELRNQ